MTVPGHAYRAAFRAELLLFLREPFAVIFTVVVPLGMLLIFGASFGEEDAGAGYRLSDIQVPSLIAVVLAYVALLGVPIVFSEYRELGVFRAYRITPLRLGVFMAAQVVVYVLMCAVASVLAVLVTRVAFGLRFGGNPALVVVVSLCCAAAVLAVGYLVACLPLGARTAQATGSILFFLSLFTSGAAVPRDQFPSWLDRASGWLPMTVVVDLLQDAWTGELGIVRGVTCAGLLVGVALSASALAARSFRPG